MQNLRDFTLKNFVELKDSILHLIYPNLCVCCQNELSKFEREICHLCQHNFHFTGFENYTEPSTLDKLFWGRIKIEQTFALLYFEKGNSTQEVLHQIKYKGKQELAVQMGEFIGKKLISNKKKIDGIDALIPVPLHLKKFFSRGYNQSELLANGVSNVTKIKVVTDFLTRKKHAESQTKKGRFMRWDNIEDAFFVEKNIHQLKHIAIIDDVVTTGSTLESCIKMILEKNPEIKISIFSVAVTK